MAELVVEAVTFAVIVVVFVTGGVLVWVLHAVEVLDGFIDLVADGDPVLVLELVTLEVTVVDILVVKVLNGLREPLAELLEVLELLTDLVFDPDAVWVLDNGADLDKVGEDELVFDIDEDEVAVFVTVAVFVLEELEVVVLDEVVVVDCCGEEEPDFEAVVVLVEVFELGIVFEFIAVWVLTFEG